MLILPVSQSYVFVSNEVCSEFKEKAVRDQITAIVPLKHQKISLLTYRTVHPFEV